MRILISRKVCNGICEEIDLNLSVKGEFYMMCTLNKYREVCS